MIVVAFVDLKDRQNEFILVLNQLLQELYVIRVSEVIPGKHVNLVHEILLTLRQRRLRTLQIGTQSL